MSRIEEIKKQRKLQGLTWTELSRGLPIKGDSLRAAFSRNSIDESFIEIMEKTLNINLFDKDNKDLSDKILELNDYSIPENIKEELIKIKGMLEESRRFHDFLADKFTRALQVTVEAQAKVFTNKKLEQ